MTRSEVQVPDRPPFLIMSFEVSQATPTDTDELLTIFEEARLFKVSKGDLCWGTEPFTLEETYELVTNGDVYMSKIDDKPAGGLILSWADTDKWGKELGNDSQAGYVHRFATNNAFRHQHVGDLLLNWVKKQIHENERRYLRLDCRAENTKLCNYYEERGFERVGMNTQNDGNCILFQQIVR